jgi:hypothetical protein
MAPCGFHGAVSLFSNTLTPSPGSRGRRACTLRGGIHPGIRFRRLGAGLAAQRYFHSAFDALGFAMGLGVLDVLGFLFLKAVPVAGNAELEAPVPPFTPKILSSLDGGGVEGTQTVREFLPCSLLLPLGTPIA